MAIFHMDVKVGTLSSTAGAVAAASYRAGEQLVNTETGEVFDYTRKEKVLHELNEIYLPKNADPQFKDRGFLWNTVERTTKRKDARVYREFEVALPIELSWDLNKEITQNWVKEQLTSRGMIVDVCFHDKRGNPHAHILCTTRGLSDNGVEFLPVCQTRYLVRNKDGQERHVSPSEYKALGTEWEKVYLYNGGGELTKSQAKEAGFHPTKDRRRPQPIQEDHYCVNWDEHSNMEIWRASWAAAVNKYLIPRGIEPIDHRSNQRRGLPYEPTIKEGPKNSYGYAERVATNIEIRQRNSALKRVIEATKRKFNEIGLSLGEHYTERNMFQEYTKREEAREKLEAAKRDLEQNNKSGLSEVYSSYKAHQDAQKAFFGQMPDKKKDPAGNKAYWQKNGEYYSKLTAAMKKEYTELKGACPSAFHYINHPKRVDYKLMDAYIGQCKLDIYSYIDRVTAYESIYNNAVANFDAAAKKYERIHETKVRAAVISQAGPAQDTPSAELAARLKAIAAKQMEQATQPAAETSTSAKHKQPVVTQSTMEVATEPQVVKEEIQQLSPISIDYADITIKLEELEQDFEAIKQEHADKCAAWNRSKGTPDENALKAEYDVVEKRYVAVVAAQESYHEALRANIDDPKQFAKDYAAWNIENNPEGNKANNVIVRRNTRLITALKEPVNSKRRPNQRTVNFPTH